MNKINFPRPHSNALLEWLRIQSIDFLSMRFAVWHLALTSLGKVLCNIIICKKKHGKLFFNRRIKYSIIHTKASLLRLELIYITFSYMKFIQKMKILFKHWSLKDNCYLKIFIVKNVKKNDNFKGLKNLELICTLYIIVLYFTFKCF